MKPALLFLCHRFPFPPDKGDKIRSFHLLSYLAEHYRVYLGAFVDDERDWLHAAEIQRWCEESKLLRLAPGRARLRSLRGLLSARPLTLPYYAMPEMSRWVAQVTRRERLTRALVFSSSMAQYVLGKGFEQVRRVIDFVDVDSDKWRQYAERQAPPLKWIYRREARKLLVYERRVASVADASLFVSQIEADLFRSLAPEAGDRVGFFSNGVDTTRFAPDLDLDSPYAQGERVIVFAGAMDYWPNVDAVEWFAAQVFQQLHADDPSVRFFIVGRNPTQAVKRLGERPGVVVTGGVADVRPYVLHSRLSVAPLRVARGIQNKVLEAMAMGRPVLASRAALEGISARPGQEMMLAEGAAEFLQQSRLALAADLTAMGARARQRVLNDYVWERHLPGVLEMLESAGPGSPVERLEASRDHG
ncbi:MAG: TIGR03087 family PEP-CTERM/XrtA system glycosyltransferase [Chromatiales bacterium]